MLSGFFSVFFISLGIVSCLVATFVAFKISKGEEKTPAAMFLTLNFFKYPLWIFKEIVKSSIDVTKIIWSSSLNISPEVAWVQTSLKDDIGLTFFANSITLTPGTVSVVVREGTIYVHALTKPAMEDLRGGEMSRRVVKAIHNK